MPHSDDRLRSIIDRLRHLFIELDVSFDADRIEDTTFLFEGGLGLDSFAVVELITLIERDFSFEFPEADLIPESFQDLRTIGAVIARNISP